MKSLAIALLLVISAQFAEADTLKCTLKSGSRRSSVSIDLNTNGGEFAVSGGVYDLSFNMMEECEDASCTAYVTVDSVIVQDEVSSFSFSFDRNKNAVVINEPFDGAPDGKAYNFSCAYKK